GVRTRVTRARSQPGDDSELAPLTKTQPGCVELDGKPWSLVASRKLVALGHDADDRVRSSVHAQRLVCDTRITAESFPPHRVPEQCRRRCAARVVSETESPANDRSHARDLEAARGHARDRDPL